ncbi:MAG: DUF1491 family protein [Sphingorhabdus sp.]|uniref:DUF1491 family protein n=1 Tax=Sphingorhabdus sp. TaxID=1902408 RepID=UPI0038FC82C1
MTKPRLTSQFRISALKKLAEVDGGFATLLRKGDLTSGAILIIGQIRGGDPILFERYPAMDGTLAWHRVTLPIGGDDAEITKYWKNRILRDPDLWVLELDVASTERLDRLLAADS